MSSASLEMGSLILTQHEQFIKYHNKIKKNIDILKIIFKL